MIYFFFFVLFVLSFCIFFALFCFVFGHTFYAQDLFLDLCQGSLLVVLEGHLWFCLQDIPTHCTLYLVLHFYFWFFFCFLFSGPHWWYPETIPHALFMDCFHHFQTMIVEPAVELRPLACKVYALYILPTLIQSWL